MHDMAEHHQSNLLKGLERLAQKCGPVVLWLFRG